MSWDRYVPVPGIPLPSFGLYNSGNQILRTFKGRLLQFVTSNSYAHSNWIARVICKCCPETSWNQSYTYIKVLNSVCCRTLVVFPRGPRFEFHPRSGFYQFTLIQFVFEMRNLSHRQIPSLNLSHRQIPTLNLSHRQIPSLNLSHRQIPSLNLSHRQIPH